MPGVANRCPLTSRMYSHGPTPRVSRTRSVTVNAVSGVPRPRSRGYATTAYSSFLGPDEAVALLVDPAGVDRRRQLLSAGLSKRLRRFEPAGAIGLLSVAQPPILRLDEFPFDVSGALHDASRALDGIGRHHLAAPRQPALLRREIHPPLRGIRHRPAQRPHVHQGLRPNRDLRVSQSVDDAGTARAPGSPSPPHTPSRPSRRGLPWRSTGGRCRGRTRSP